MTLAAANFEGRIVEEEAGLVEGFVRRDPAAFDRAVRAYQPRVARLAQRLLGWQSGEVEDVVQEVFLVAWEKAGRFRRESSLWTWLTAITLNRCRTWRRRWKVARAARSRMIVNEQTAAADEAAAGEESAGRVRKAVGRLPARDREVVVLFYLEERSAAEIGEILGVRRNAVDVRLHRARARLKEMLGDEGMGVEEVSGREA